MFCPVPHPLVPRRGGVQDQNFNDTTLLIIDLNAKQT